MREAPTPERLLHSEAEAQALLGIGYHTLRDLRDSGDIKHVTIGRRVLYPRAELLAFIEKRLHQGR